jgi:hypothetical protein
MRPELAVKNKVKALERKKAQLHALIIFLQRHPEIAAETTLKELSGRTGLYFEDYAIIRPRWLKDHVVLRLEKYTTDWGELDPNYGSLDAPSRIVHEDITNLSVEELKAILNKIDAELHPDEHDDEG